MGASFNVEVLNRSGEVKYRQAVTSFPFRIGRGYDADLILDDPYIDSLHVAVSAGPDGELLVTDQGSLNGSDRIVAGRSERIVAAVAVGPNDRLRIGQTMLRIRPADYAVPAAIPVPVLRRRNPVLVLLAFLVMLMAIIDDDWYRPADMFFDRLPGTLLVGTAVVGIWSGILALVGQAFTRRIDFFGHLLIVCVGITAFQFTWRLFDLATFAFGLDQHKVLRLSLYSLVVGAAFYLHLKQFSRADRRLLASSAIFVAAAIVFSPILLDKFGEKKDRSQDIRSPQVILPPLLLATPGVSLDEFIGQIDHAKKEALQLAERFGGRP